MDMDYTLLDTSVGNNVQDVEEPPVIGEEEAAMGAAVEPEATPPSVDKQVPQLPTDDFDESLPLTPREKVLMERLDRIQGENLVLSKPVVKDTTPAPTLSDRNFLDGFDMDEVLASSENLNKLLLSVYNSAMEAASKLSAEQVLQNLPQIMSTYVTNHLTMTKMAEKFYSDNPDLASSSQTVAAVANKIAAEHPEYTAEQVFDASAIEARKILRIKAAATTTDSIKSTTRPAFTGPNRGRNGVKAPVLSDVEKGVLDLISG